MVGVRSPESGQPLPEETHALTSLAPPSPSSLRPGDHLGSYRLLDVLGEGATGRVFSAEHTIRGQRVAIKIIHPELSLHEATVFSCFAEARRVSELALPGTAHVHDLVLGNEFFPTFSVMERLQGQPLAAFMESSPSIPLDTVYRIGIALAQTLDTVHQQGVAHCRLHPGNVFLGTSEGLEPSVKILDFGIGKLSSDFRRTIHAPFFAPDPIEDGQSNELVDIFGLGAILRALVEAQDVRPGKPAEAPQGLLDLIERCTNPVALRRPRTAAEVHEALTSLFSELQRTQRRRRILQAGLLAVLLSLVVWGWQSVSTAPPIHVEALPVLDETSATPAVEALKPSTAGAVSAPTPAPPQGVGAAPVEDPPPAPAAEVIAEPQPSPDTARQPPRPASDRNKTTAPPSEGASSPSSSLSATPMPPVQPPVKAPTPESIDPLIVKDPFTEGL